MRPPTKTKAELVAELTDLQSQVRELEGMALRADFAEKNLLQAKAELDHRRAEVSALMESFGAIMQYRSFQDAARSIFLACRKLVGATAGYVALLTPDGKTNDLLFLDSGGLRCTVDPSLPMPVRGLRAEAYGGAKAVYDNDFDASAWVNFLPHGHMQLRNVLFAPLVIDGRAVGLLGLANKAGGFNQDDLRMASGFGEIAAVALKNSRTLEALTESEERFRLAFEGSNDGVGLVDLEGRFLKVNDRMCEILGYTRDELEAMTVREVTHRDDLHISASYMRRSRAGEIERSVFEKRYVHKGGHVIWGQVSASMIRAPGGEPLCYISHVQDITERKRAEEALRRSHDELERRVAERTVELARANEELRASEAKYSTLVENSLTGISINLDGRIVFANDKFAEIFGYSREELIGIEVWRLVHPGDRALVEEMRTRRLRGDPVPAEYESRGLTKEGKIIWVARRNAVIDYEGKPATLGNLVEVTKRRNIEEALRRSERELRHLSSELLSAQESERGRIARELHDGIGQWLSAIKFRVEDAVQQARRGRAEGGFQLLERVIPLIRKAIDEIRRISMDLRPATLDSLGILATVSWLCRQFEETYRAVRVSKNFAIQEEQVPEGLKVVIYRILQEALNNVAKHSEAGRVRVRLGKEEGRIELSIKDNGKGFDLASVLNDQTEKPGFGLASMRERTELSGGSFCLESGKGKGTLIRASWSVE